MKMQRFPKIIFIMMPIVYFISIILPVLFLEYRYSQAQFDRLSRVGALLAETVPEAEKAFLAALKQTMDEDGQVFLLQNVNRSDNLLPQNGSQRRNFLLENGYRSGGIDRTG